MSDGRRERASPRVKVLKSSQEWSVRRSAVRSIAGLDRSRGKIMTPAPNKTSRKMRQLGSGLQPISGTRSGTEMRQRRSASPRDARSDAKAGIAACSKSSLPTPCAASLAPAKSNDGHPGVEPSVHRAIWREWSHTQCRRELMQVAQSARSNETQD